LVGHVNERTNTISTLQNFDIGWAEISKIW
jgi:hypothetical protein